MKRVIVSLIIGIGCLVAVAGLLSLLTNTICLGVLAQPLPRIIGVAILCVFYVVVVAFKVYCLSYDACWLEPKDETKEK